MIIEFSGILGNICSTASDHQPDYKGNKGPVENSGLKAPDAISMSTEKEDYICLDQHFSSYKEAEIWYSKILNSKLPDKRSYILQRSTVGGVKHIICFDASEKHLSMTENMKNLINVTGLKAFIFKVPAKKETNPQRNGNQD